MKKKVFSLMMTLLLAFMGVAKADVVTIGEGTGTTYYFPIDNFFNYSCTQQIYTADEIGTAGTINAISFYYNYGTAYTASNVTMYMKNVSRSTFAATTDYEPLAVGDIVWTGAIAPTGAGWYTFTLDTPFAYDGSSNLLVAFFDGTSGYPGTSYTWRQTTSPNSAYMALRYYSDSYCPDPYNLGSYNGSKTWYTYRANVQIDITAGGGGAGEQIFAVQNDEIVDTVFVGSRPNGCWMEPFTFQIRNTGASTTITHLDWTPQEYFTLVAPELPVQIARNEDIDVQLTTGESTNTDWQMVAIYGTGRTAALWNINVDAYDPAVPDVVEFPCEEATTFPFVEWPAQAHNTELHNDYTLPFPEIPEGNDAVYKLVFDNDVMLNAEVTSGNDGKVALYTEDFYGEGGPMATNNYVGPTSGAGGSSSAGGAYEAQIGDGTSTTGYLPMYYLYNYSLSTQLFLGTELTAAGATTAAMSSVSWFSNSTYGYNIQNVSIWMGNVSDTQVSSTSPLGSGMSLVYQGNHQEVVGWNEFVFNAGNFAWDGHSNVLVMVQMNNGSWSSSIQWQCHNAGFNAGSYVYQDNTPYSAGTTTYSMSTTTNRANTLFKAGNREGSRELITIAAGGYNAVAIPVNFIWAYTENQMILTADEIGAAGNIMSVAYKRYSEGSGNPETRNIDIYMMHTTMDAYSSTSDWIPVTAADLVYSGNYTFQTTGEDWQTITLQTPFAYNGTDNLCICIDDNTGTTTTRQYWSCHNTPVARSMRAWGSSDFYPTSAGTPSGGSSLTGAFVADIQLDISEGFLESGEITLHDGTATNNFIPAYGFYADAYLKAEFVYPATELSDMNGGTIDAMTFYASTPATEAWTSTWQVFMSEVTDASISSFYGPGTVVYEGALDGTGAEMTINFITPYQYNGGNLLVGIYNITTGNYKSVTWAGEAVDGASISGYNYSGLSSITATQRNFLPKTNFSYISSGGVFHPLVVMQNGEEINSINVGSRPNGYWMEPFTFQMRNKSSNTMVSLIDFTPQGYFSIVTPETPFNIARNEVVDIQLATGESTDTEWQMMVLYGEEPDIATWTIMAEPYDPACPDVWELAYDLGAVSSGFSYQGIPSQIMPTELHNDYTLPFPEIEEGVDAVYKFEVATDLIINAFVDETAENGKVALYTEDFYGEGGPMATNNYTGLSNYNNRSDRVVGNRDLIDFESGNLPTGWDASQGDNNWYVDTEDYWGHAPAYAGNYSLYVDGNGQYNNDYFVSPAIQFNGAGTLSFAYATPSWSGDQNDLSVGYGTSVSGPWTIFSSANGLQSESWQTATVDLSSLNGTYYIAFISYDGYGYGTAIDNINIDVSTTPTPGAGIEVSAGPIINNLGLTAGTYYLVASSTDADFGVNISFEDMPCPLVDEFEFYPYPEDNATEIESFSVTLHWTNPEYATAWRLVFGTSYYPDPEHEQTIITEWNNTMTDSFTLSYLRNNTNYFWHVEFSNENCPEGVSSPVWGFTTHLNIPQNLAPVDYTVFNDESITLNWNAVVDRAYHNYNVYRDGVLIGSTEMDDISATTYTDGPLAYNMDGYTYYVTAVYDEGESAPSNNATVYVSGYGDVNGHVYEQDGETGIANAIVTLAGIDEFGMNRTYNFITNSQGYYSGHICAGVYNGSASCNGYQVIDEPVQSNPITITYNEVFDPMDFILDETFNPVKKVIAEYYPDSLDSSSHWVKVYWSNGLYGDQIVESFESGDFSQFDWQNGSVYPWSITTNNPYDGAYCMKSGGEGIANAVSSMTVTLDIPDNGEMSFYGKISSWNYRDYGYFYIDGVEKSSFTGLSSWEEKTYFITAGIHTFEWRYTKSNNAGGLNDDCFYVDQITFYKQPEPAVPGWHTYCESEFNNAVGSSVGQENWAYEYPASFLHTYYAGWQITKVSLFSDNVYNAVGGNYTCRIYEGGELPAAGTLVSTLTVDVPQGLNDWSDWDLATPVYVTGEDPIWVVWTANTKLSNWPVGCCGNLNQLGTWWNGGNGWEHLTYGTWTMRQWFTDTEGRNVAVIAANNALVNTNPINSQLRTFENGEESNDVICANPYAVNETSFGKDNTRSLSYYKVYRTNAYNFGPYAEENTVFVAPVWHPDTSFIDIWWDDLEAGVYKWGVSVVYEGNRDGGNNLLQEPRESKIVWSNFIDKDMYLGEDAVSISVSLNSGDSPEGVMVSFTNLIPKEQSLYPIDAVTLDATGHYAWDSFRRGDYVVQVSIDGYEPITEEVSIWEATDLSYVLNEIIYDIPNLYVSSTGWAMWGDSAPAASSSITGDTFIVNFEEGIPEGWTINDANQDGYTWCLTSAIPSTWTYYASQTLDWYHNGSNAICSGSYINGIGALNPDEWLISPAVDIVDGSQLSFWAAATDVSYAADHFGVFVSTTGTDPGDFTSVQEWTLTAKKEGLPGGDASRNGKGLRLGTWFNFTVDLSAYADNECYIAFRHYNCYDMYIMTLDDIELTDGAKNQEGAKHFEQYQVVLSDTEDNVIYQGITYDENMQLPVEDLVDGETYRLKVASVYTTGTSQWKVTNWIYQSCSNYEGVTNLLGETVDDGYLITWEYDNGESTRNGNSISTNAQLLCLEYGLQGYPASVDAGVGEEGPDYGCLYSRPNPSWYYFRIDYSGGIDINMYSDPSVDIDFCCWGPFDDPHTPCPYGLTEEMITDCSYSANWSETCHIPETAQEGEYYILMLTNYSNQECNFYFQQTGGTGSSHCSDVIGYMFYRDGELLGMTTENSYFDEGGNYEHEYSVRVVHNGPIALPSNNIYYSMSCPQTIGGAIYEVTVSADPEEYGVATGEGSYINGFPCTLTATPTSDYSFVNWTINGEVVSTDATYTFLVTEDSDCVAHFTYIQETPLAAGWNWWSTYVEQEGINGLQLLENSLGGAGIRIQGKDASTDYFEYQGVGYWYGPLNAINNEQMYKIHTSESCNAMVNGAPAQAANHPILINYGWNWMGYPVAESISVNDALSGLNAQPNDVIKGRNVSATYVSSGNYNEWYGTLNSLDPGQGYMYKSNDYNSKMLVFQTGRENGVAEPNITPANNVFIPAGENYADNMLITAVVEVNGEELRSDEYELAAFVGDECRGSVKLMYIEPFDRYVAFLLVFGDKEENLHFVLTDGSETGASREQITYTIDGMAGTLTEPITLHFGTLGIDADQLFVNVYPNPSKGVFNIEGSGIQKVEVVNTYGQVILSTEVENDFLQINLGNQAAGTYLLRVVTANGTTTRRLVTTR